MNTTFKITFNDSIYQTNNDYVDLQHVTNLGLYNKYILVTLKQVLELYITAIESKTLYSLHIPHTAFPNVTRLQLKQQQTKHKGPGYQDRNRNLALSENILIKYKIIFLHHSIHIPLHGLC